MAYSLKSRRKTPTKRQNKTLESWRVVTKASKSHNGIAHMNLQRKYLDAYDKQITTANRRYDELEQKLKDYDNILEKYFKLIEDEKRKKHPNDFGIDMTKEQIKKILPKREIIWKRMKSMESAHPWLKSSRKPF